MNTHRESMPLSGALWLMLSVLCYAAALPLGFLACWLWQQGVGVFHALPWKAQYLGYLLAYPAGFAAFILCLEAGRVCGWRSDRARYEQSDAIEQEVQARLRMHVNGRN